MASVVELKPFQHQVGGNSCMLHYDIETVSKPFVEREYVFYKTAPDALLPFLPQFKGVADVRFLLDDKDECISFEAFNLCQSVSLEDTSDNQLSSSRQSREDYLKIIENQINGGAESSPDSPFFKKMNKKIVCSCDLVLSKVPWKQNTQKTFTAGSLQQLKDIFEASKKHPKKILLLQNIISSHRYPCVMDIKVGTRLHHDDMTEEKKVLSIWRCGVSTSNELALRMGGLKVYNVEDDSYIVMDKYAGRLLNREGFENSMHLFFKIAEPHRSHIISLIAKQLEQLYKAIMSCSEIRLYACSLLVIYDGDLTNTNYLSKTHVKIIDFENASTKSNYESPTDGCVLGIKNLLKIINNL